MPKLRAFSERGPGRNVDPKISLMRKSATAATSTYTSGGLPKRKAPPKLVTLPTKAMKADDIR